MAKQKTWLKVLLGLVVVAVGAIAVYAVNPETFQGSLRNVKILDPKVVRDVEPVNTAVCNSGDVVFQPGNSNAMYQSQAELAQAISNGTLPSCTYDTVLVGPIPGSPVTLNLSSECPKESFSVTNSGVPRCGAHTNLNSGSIQYFDNLLKTIFETRNIDTGAEVMQTAVYKSNFKLVVK